MTRAPLLVQGGLVSVAYPASMHAQSLVRRIFFKDDRLRPILRVIIYCICAVVGFILLYAAAAPALGNSPPVAGQQPPLKSVALIEVVSGISIVGFAILLRRLLDRRSVESLGLAPRGRWAGLLGLGIALGAGMQLLVFALEAALGYVHVSHFGDMRGDAVALALYVPLYLVVAINEEILLRGYLFQNLWEEWGIAAAIVITSAVFAALHLNNPGSHQELFLTLSGLAAYGIWACLSVLWTKSLWLAVGVHFAWNLFEGPVLGFPVSGLDYGNTVMHQAVSGPTWFTGGAFGPESGASSLIALATGAVVLYWLRKRGAFDGAYDARESYARGSQEMR